MSARPYSDHELALKSVQLRKLVLKIIFNTGAGHTGGSLSCLDILNVLYNRVLRVTPATTQDPKRDRYVQSKGHAVEALYAVLCDRGYFPASKLDTIERYQSKLVGHPTRKVPGIEMNTGGLGHGLPICVGMAMAEKLDQAGYRTFTLLGDGELAEGSNWEAAMAAGHYKLDKLTAIIDCNKLQISGRTRDVCTNEPLDEKFRAFGWGVRVIDGNNITAVSQALSGPAEPGKPTCVIANTIKGKGVSFMEDVVKWHHGVPTEQEMQQAMRDLEAAEAKLKEVAQ